MTEKEAADRRRLRLEAGAELMKITYADWPLSVSADDSINDRIEGRLKEALEAAKAALDKFRKARAARLALDVLLPGWRYVDASDYLPKEKWRSFVSNDEEETVSWLVENGVDQERAEKLVAWTFSPT